MPAKHDAVRLAETPEWFAVAAEQYRTLYYRLERITEITGLDLQDGGDRLLLHTGLLVSDLTGSDGED